MRAPQSPANAFFANGLHSIETHHHTQRHMAEAAQQRSVAMSAPQATGPVRRQAGSLLIALGQLIAGCRTARPHTARFV